MITNNLNPLNDGLLIEGSQYTIGTNDGKEFKKVAFNGYKQLNGKPMMVFRTIDDKQITINPSFHTFTIEEDTEMNPVAYRQSRELKEGVNNG